MDQSLSRLESRAHERPWTKVNLSAVNIESSSAERSQHFRLFRFYLRTPCTSFPSQFLQSESIEVQAVRKEALEGRVACCNDAARLEDSSNLCQCSERLARLHEMANDLGCEDHVKYFIGKGKSLEKVGLCEADGA